MLRWRPVDCRDYTHNTRLYARSRWHARHCRFCEFPRQPFLPIRCSWPCLTVRRQHELRTGVQNGSLRLVLGVKQSVSEAAASESFLDGYVWTSSQTHFAVPLGSPAPAKFTLWCIVTASLRTRDGMWLLLYCIEWWSYSSPVGHHMWYIYGDDLACSYFRRATRW